MEKPISVHILNCQSIKTSASGSKYRHILLEDISNHKKVDYIIFENHHKFIWLETLKEPMSDLFYPGEIICLKITQNILSKFKSGLPLTIKVGDIVDIVKWYWSEWDTFSEDMRIQSSLRDQIWRFRSFPKKNKEKYSNSDSESESDPDFDNTSRDSNDSNRDYFDAMTNGILGDYDDFHGNLDDIDSWSRG